MIAIIDYGAGNIQSVAKALTHIGCDCLVTRNKDEILKADGAVLPGVGSFGDTVDSLNKYGIKDAIKEYIASGKPFLGICLGMQLLFPASGESPEAEGLGIYEGSITRIPNGEGLKIPHMGWNSLDINPESRLFKGIGKNPYVYFVHSYFLHAADRELVAATTEYGVTIDAAVERGNVFATQFHPEK
ncbi:MAG: imidazole glycerol phosphate synthase subunit HisH, partial [Ruminococcus sp.]|nr:imidazole glycerol phosphate synthase subunit HisH [Ruminococcus sp.]